MKDTLWGLFVERRLKELEERRLALDKKQQKKVNFNDTQEIDNLLFDIVDGKIEGFKIILGLYAYGELLFTREGDFLLISIKLSEEYEGSNEPYLEEADFELGERIPNPLKALGFEFVADKRSYIYRYDLANFKDAVEIKILLSRLFFDVFNIYDVSEVISIKGS